MSKDNLKIILAVIFVIAMFTYINLREYGNEDRANDVGAQITEEIKEDPAPQPDTENSDESTTEEDEQEETPPFLDSFNEEELEGESNDVQTGIDLLKNPLQ